MAAVSKTGSMVVLLALALVGCKEDDQVIAYKKIRSLPTAELEQKITQLPAKEQVDIYVIAVSRIRPSDTRLAPILAKQGNKILPAIVSKLNAAEPGVPPEALVLVLNMMVLIYHVDEAKVLAPRVPEWCDRFYKDKGESYCREMGREMAKD